jgi:hypothetical protein
VKLFDNNDWPFDLPDGFLEYEAKVLLQEKSKP